MKSDVARRTNRSSPLHAFLLLLALLALLGPGSSALAQPKPPAPVIKPSSVISANVNPGDYIDSVSISLDGQRVAFASPGGPDPLHIFDLTTEKELFCLKNQKGGFVCAALAPDGKTFATTKSIGEPARIWDAKTYKVLHELKHSLGSNHLAYSPDSKLLATFEENNHVCLWDVATGKEIVALPFDKGGDWPRVAFAPDGRSLVAATWWGFVQVWDLSGPTPLKELHKHKPAQSIATGVAQLIHVGFTPDSRLVVTASQKQPVQFWDVATGKLRKEVDPSKYITGIRAVALSADGSALALGGMNPTVVLWDLTTDKLSALLGPFGSPVRSLAIAQDGSFLIAGHGNGTAEVYKLPKKN
jgi:WD40 repeat protein